MPSDTYVWDDEKFLALPKRSRKTIVCGREVYFSTDKGSPCFRHLGNNKVLKKPLPCLFCKLKFTEYRGEGPLDFVDPCLGVLPGVKFACCGHGVVDGYLFFENGVRLILKKREKDFDGQLKSF